MSATVTTHEIAESLRARIEAVREELEGYDSLREELARLESALADLEPTAPDRRRARDSKASGDAARRSSTRPPQARSAASRRAPSSSKGGSRSQTRERIVAFIREHGSATAGEVATGLNLNRNSVATRLTQLTKAGELEKAERGYTARATNGSSKT